MPHFQNGKHDHELLSLLLAWQLFFEIVERLPLPLRFKAASSLKAANVLAPALSGLADLIVPCTFYAHDASAIVDSANESSINPASVCSKKMFI
jgi:hypothetical protein